ncbi:MAG: hypothetical protein U9Q03_06135 [Patescibacteria group bacterium]|nr:hypothetical protein [Patescibacteria group bacterium]
METLLLIAGGVIVAIFVGVAAVFVTRLDTTKVNRAINKTNRSK